MALELEISEINDKIEEMVRRLVVSFAPEKVVLFGSYAKGLEHTDSDVDLLVVKPILHSKRKERIQMRLALRGLGLAKDIVLVTPEDVERYQNVVGTIIESALKEGKVLYERTE